MFSMSYLDESDDYSTNVEMKFEESDDPTLTQMLARFMVMMHKIGYHDVSWNSILDNMNEWRCEYGNTWASDFMYDQMH